MQQNVKARILQHLTTLVNKNIKEGIDTPSTIWTKLTGDDTQIGRGLNVVNIAMREERLNLYLGTIPLPY